MRQARLGANSAVSYQPSHNCKNLGSNPGHDRLLLWVWGPHIFILVQNKSKPRYWYWSVRGVPCKAVTGEKKYLTCQLHNNSEQIIWEQKLDSYRGKWNRVTPWFWGLFHHISLGTGWIYNSRECFCPKSAHHTGIPMRSSVLKG